MSLYGLGLGKMTVKSALDQPFSAEIELVDLGSAAVDNIRVNIADPQNFTQIGMERTAIVSLLTFTVSKNDSGKYIIKVESNDKMVEPYIEIVVDLTWPDGELFKAYTVLLDPPGYKLITSSIQGGKTHYRKQVNRMEGSGVKQIKAFSSSSQDVFDGQKSQKSSTYGPTITNENIWQIAQHFKNSDIILPQVVLAIVGANPDAFTNGNLNGLKVGVRLSIPSNAEMLKVPADLATSEVMAHDKAWNNQTSVDHVLSPPFVNNQAPDMSKVNTTGSSVPNTTIPKLVIPAIMKQNLDSQLMTSHSGESTKSDNTHAIIPNDRPHVFDDSTTKAELSITMAAIESVRESNYIIVNQLNLLQKQNGALQKQLDQSNKEVITLREQVKVMKKLRKAVASQASTAIDSNQSSVYLPIMLLLLAAAGGGFAFWYFKIRRDEDTETSTEKNSLAKQLPLVAEIEIDSLVSDVNTVEQSNSKPTTSDNLIANVLNEDLKDNKDNEDLTEVKSSDSDEQQVIASPAKTNSKKKKTSSSDIKSDEQTQDSQVILDSSILTPDLEVKTESILPETHTQEIEKNTVDNKDDQLLNDLDGQLELQSGLNHKEQEEDKQVHNPEIESENHSEESLPNLEFSISEEPLSETISNDDTMGETAKSSMEKNIINPVKTSSMSDNNTEEEDPSEYLLEFETGLMTPVVKAPEEQPEKLEAKEKNNEVDEEGVIDFEPVSFEKVQTEPEELNQSDLGARVVDADEDHGTKAADLAETLNSYFKDTNQDDENDTTITFDFDEETTNEAQSVEQPINENITDEGKSDVNPPKSIKALETLLALAKTYIGMDDVDSARNALEEVAEYGTESQKEEANKLLDQIKDK